MTAPAKYTAADLVRLIRARHEERAGWTVFEELAAGTGFSRATQRWADVLALQTFPSRGISAHGYEVKVSRSDLVAELRDPRKAHEFQRWCDYWWLAVPDASIYDGLVIPDTWGILVVHQGRRLKPAREAPKLEPQPWDKPFCAAVGRAYSKGLVPKREVNEIEARIDALVEERVGPAVERELERRRDAADRTARELEQLKAAVARFEEASGVKIDRWRHGDVGEAVRALMVLRNQGSRFDHFVTLAEDFAQRARAVRDAHSALVAEKGATP